jgi:hypothetical protein
VSYNGDGTEQNPYEVGNVDQLQCINNQSLTANYTQVSDIDASETSAWNEGKGFEPIGNNATRFNGTFNGSGFTIAGLYINRSRDPRSGSGLFGKIDSTGLIKNTRLEKVNVIETSPGPAGSLVGINNRGDINNSYATVVFVSGTTVGGLVGKSYGRIFDSYATGNAAGCGRVGGLVGKSYGRIFDSYATVNVSSECGRVGGLVGVTADGVIESSYAAGSISGSRTVGGLVGLKSRTNISNSYATGNVSGSGKSIGGLVGVNNEGSITKSYATGNVTGHKGVGGIVGLNQATINSSYATGNVSGNKEVGGLIGTNVAHSSGPVAVVNSSYATGNVFSSGDNAGGLIGWNTVDGGPPPVVSSSYATGNVFSSGDNVGGLVGYNEEGAVESSHATGQISVADNNPDGTDSNVGGLVGINDEGSIAKSYATGNVTGSAPNVGGLVGINKRGSVTKSYATGNISGDEIVGGLIGDNEATVNLSYATGTVSGNGTVGGLVGENGVFRPSAIVKRSYATGDVSASTIGIAGGLVGDNNEATVTSSYVTGEVSGDFSGGVVGLNPNGTVNESYWNTETFSQSLSGEVIGLTTTQMIGSAAVDNMTGLNFSVYWETVTNPDDYPVLAWQTEGNGSDPAPAFFEVTIDSTNSPVTEGENLTVTATVTNTGGKQDTQTVTGRLSGLAPPVSTPITLDAGNSTTKTRTVATEAGDAGSYTVNVSSEDDLALATVNVTRDSRGNFTEPLPVPGFAGPPQNIPVSQGGFNDSLVEDLDGDGNPTDIGPTVSVFGELIRGNDLGLTDAQARKLDWNSGSPADKVTVADMVTLFGKQIRAE